MLFHGSRLEHIVWLAVSGCSLGRVDLCHTVLFCGLLPWNTAVTVLYILAVLHNVLSFVLLCNSFLFCQSLVLHVKQFSPFCTVISFCILYGKMDLYFVKLVIFLEGGSLE